MKYPKFLNEKDSIGLLATSCGSNVNPYRIRTQKGIQYFEKLGYQIKKGHRIYRNVNAVSAPASLRGKDFMSMYKNKNIHFLWSTGGGEIMMSMLPFVDFEKIKQLSPKYFMGFSDNTNLTFTLTTLCDIATIYASSIGSFAYDTLPCDTVDTYLLMQGKKLSFQSYPFYYGPESQTHLKAPLTPLSYYDENLWKSMDNQSFNLSGRMIGGCLDILISLCGTRYDQVRSFIEKYKEDGILWYFDVCDLNSTALYRALFQLKEAGWFQYAKGFLIGRPFNSITPLNYSFYQAIIDSISELNVPILYDVDISHIRPSIPIINGAYANIQFNEHKGNISFILK